MVSTLVINYYLWTKICIFDLGESMVRWMDGHTKPPIIFTSEFIQVSHTESRTHNKWLRRKRYLFVFILFIPFGEEKEDDDRGGREMEREKHLLVFIKRCPDYDGLMKVLSFAQCAVSVRFCGGISFLIKSISPYVFVFAFVCVVEARVNCMAHDSNHRSDDVERIKQNKKKKTYQKLSSSSIFQIFILPFCVFGYFFCIFSRNHSVLLFHYLLLFLLLFIGVESWERDREISSSHRMAARERWNGNDCRCCRCCCTLIKNWEKKTARTRKHKHT